jgi:hypothetical protein
MKKTTRHLIAEVPRRQPKVAMTIGTIVADYIISECLSA